ncbi:MAG: DUF1553 domain-containing protein [Pirellulales bacterium]
MSARGRFLLACTIAVCASGAYASDGEQGAKIDYDRQIRPILSDKCYRCHGPDAETREADMRLDRRDGISNDVLMPGKPDESELVRRIMSEDEAERMPPPDSHLALSNEEKRLISQWIAEGAEFTEHWSFRPLPKEVVVPAVRDESWPRNEIDRFVLARLERAGLQPSPQADRLRLLRRVTLDLTGLPPTLPEIQDFEQVSAKDGEAALVNAVDRLLASSAYGEQMAVAWLDAARYADSYGYQSDQLNTQWPYRDWVVRALNSNVPFDQFLTWQLAGDLLDHPTREQILATAFNRLHRLTNEGGSIAEECRAEIAADRVQTFGTALLGLTIECARCHDHKYDPITTRDYYSLSAFFNSIDESGMYIETAKVPTPSLLLPTVEQEAALSDAKQAIAAAEAELERQKVEAESRLADWLASERPSAAELRPLLNESFEGELFELASQSLDPKSRDEATHLQRVPGVRGNGVRFDGDFAAYLDDSLHADRSDEFSVDFWLRDTERNSLPVVVLQKTQGTDVGYNGFDVMLAAGFLEARLFRVWPGNGIGVRALEPIAKGQWQHMTITYDGSSRASGFRLYFAGKEVPTAIVRDRIYKSTVGGNYGKGHLMLGGRFRDRGFQGGEIDELQLFDRVLAPLEIENLQDANAMAAALADPAARREEVQAYYLAAVDPLVQQARDKLRAARQALVEAENPIQEIPVMQELPEPRPTYVLPRGAYDAPKTDANRVERRTFEEILSPLPPDAPRDRLGLARWLTAPDHPLTARVFVNRMWANFFGRGLVATPENFGRQGAAPTHPELLDWLARDFVDHGWDVKRLCRQIVLSATYQQDSRLRPELREKDAENLLLARGPSRRLSAEQIRDVALAASGLLNRELGGPPVSPYQPGEDLWREANQMSPAYQQSVGTALHRRSLYSVWKRTVPLPNMLAFDSPTREVCVVSRGRTSTPLQALVLLNDVQFVEAARALAETVAAEHQETVDQINAAFLRLTGRSPDETETQLLEEVYHGQLAAFESGAADDATKFTSLGDLKLETRLQPAELSALTATCQVILNLDATIYSR